MKKTLLLLTASIVTIKSYSQIYEESRYQLMFNYKFKEKNTISFQPEMRVQDFTKNTTITLWRLLYIRQWNDRVHSHIGADWFNNWHNYDVSGHELRTHIETGFKEKFGKWTYFNRYRLDYRNYFTNDWEYTKSVFRFRYMINWSRDLYHNEKGQKLTLYLANEVFLNIAGTKHFNIFDQNRLGGYLVYKLNSTISIRGTYWWEFRKNNNYNHQLWLQLGFSF
ncbi:MAG: hypothetical protein KatS3mg027_0160 [Bacteroidia bacterium]|nr:MAG: hypothetical protein KatS3mg027_0160 [Bacteroidia bacterium]